MKIVQIVPGSGDNFYCENCVRDVAVIRALRAAGHDVTAVPLYLPHLLDTLDATTRAPIFFGGINAYLQQRYGLFRRTPRWLDAVLDAGPLLRMAAKRAGSAAAEDLGELTLSLLLGAEGNQRKELDRLVGWLQGEDRPDVVHLSNPMLLGIGLEIKRRLGVPIACSLQDEDVWIDEMTPDYRERVWETMARGAQEVAAFTAVSHQFGEVMKQRMRIPDDRLHVVRIGLDAALSKRSELPHDPPVIGFLAQMSQPLGLGLLVDAFLELRARPELRGLRLHVSGGKAAADDVHLGALRKKIAAAGAREDVQFFDDFDPEARADFMSSLTAFCVPAPNGIAFGLSALEAMAAGVPAALPDRGAFPELIEATGGGVLYEPGEGQPARALGELLADRERLAALGKAGRAAVAEKFSLETMASELAEVYRKVIAAQESRPS